VYILRCTEICKLLVAFGLSFDEMLTEIKIFPLFYVLKLFLSS